MGMITSLFVGDIGLLHKVAMWHMAFGAWPCGLVALLRMRILIACILATCTYRYVHAARGNTCQ